MGADSDATLNILLKLGVIGQADVKAARDLLEDTGTAAKETGKSADFLSPAMANSGKAMNEAAGETKNLFENHKLLHAAIHQTGAEIPGLSALLHGLFNPATIGLVAGMAAIQAYFEHVKKVQEKQLEWIQELQKSNDALHEITSSGKSAGEQLVDINKALAEGQIKAHGYSHDIDQMTQMWKSYDEQVKGAASSQQQADSDAAAGMKTRIDLLEKAGILTKQRAENMRAEAAYEVELSKVQAERAAKENQYKELEREQGEAVRKRNALPSDADAQKKLANDQEALTRNESIITKMPAILAQLKSQADEAFEKADIKNFRAINERIDKFKEMLEKARSENPDLEKRVAQDKDAIAAMGALDKKIEELTGQMNALNQSIIESNRAGQAHLEAASKQRDMTEFGDLAARMLKHAEDIAKRYTANPISVSQSELTEMTRTAEYATGHAQTAKTAANVLSMAARNMNQFGKDVETMVQMMEQLAYALPPNLSNRLQALENFIARGDRPRQ